MRIILLAVFFFCCGSSIHSQQLVYFPADDGVIVYADLYSVNDTFPFILLFHQEGASRGEYLETAPRLNKLGFNCLAVDMRNGREMNYVRNETFHHLPDTLPSSVKTRPENDIRAAIQYISEQYTGDIILMGSSIAATLAVKVAVADSLVSAAIAFSPGEYFLPAYSLKNDLASFEKPLFVAGSRREYAYLNEMVSKLPAESFEVFQPENGEGLHGSRSLWSANSSRDEYWLALLLFLRNLRE